MPAADFTVGVAFAATQAFAARIDSVPSRHKTRSQKSILSPMEKCY